VPEDTMAVNAASPRETATGTPKTIKMAKVPKIMAVTGQTS